MHKQLSRQQKIQQFRGKIEQEGFPRLQMLLMVFLTGASGFIASYTLLQAGLAEMWLRYLAALTFAYLIFLLLLWLKIRVSLSPDLPDVSSLVPSPTHVGQSADAACRFGGGTFGGGGASGSFDGVTEGVAIATDSVSPVGEALGAAADAEEFAIPLVVVILVGALLLSSFFVVYSAPTLFAELTVDGMLAASLYRRLNKANTHAWLETAFRHTFWPFVLTGICITIVGWAMGLYAPEADSIGDVLLHAQRVK
ncbi:MAG: hypothetical protein ACOY8P_12450 [Thermodesulfobacteriota bacterium]